jgi:DNA-binding beta-propeller fold protein YncE
MKHLSVTAAICAAGFAGLAAAGAMADPVPGASGLRVVASIAGPDGGWDYASFDSARRRVYIPHGTRVMVIEADGGKVNQDFAPGDHLHSVIAVPGQRVIVTTNSGDSSARILNGADGKLLASIPTAKDTDGAVFDPSTGLVLVIDGDSGEVTLVDPKTRASPGSIVIGDPLEFGAVDGKGRFFVNLVSKNQVAVIDIAARKVVARYDMPGCGHPTGIAYVEGNRIVAACGNGVAKILDAGSGAEIASFKIGGFPDSVLYDPVRSLAYIPSALSGTLAVIALKGAAANTLIDTVPTQLGARTGAVDPKTGRIWLPTAEYQLPVPAGHRPTPKPGTFHVLVLDRR